MRVNIVAGPSSCIEKAIQEEDNLPRAGMVRIILVDENKSRQVYEVDQAEFSYNDFDALFSQPSNEVFLMLSKMIVDLQDKGVIPPEAYSQN